MTTPHSSPLQIPSSGEADTHAIGARLAAALQGGLVVAINGDLGVGKTRLVKAIVGAAGGDASLVNSPTYVLIQEYATRWPIYHFDTYRLADTDEFLELGADELMYGPGVCLIEWASRITEVLPADHLEIKITRTSETDRNFQFKATGPKSQTVIDRLRQNQ